MQKSGLEYDMDAQVGDLVDSSVAKVPDKTTLVGKFVMITPVDPEKHISDLYENICGEGRDRLWQYMWDGPYHDITGFRKALEEKSQSKDPFFYTIIDKKSNKAVGMCSFLRIVPVHRVIEIGCITYSPLLQRTVAATEVQYLMAKYAFEVLNYRRYEWKCDALNKPSRKAAFRLGFEFDGIFRQHMIIKGRSRDTAWFSMLDKDWSIAKEAFEAWLDPKNFDEQGTQKQSLRDIREQIKSRSS